jgi:hypothetical protein
MISYTQATEVLIIRILMGWVRPIADLDLVVNKRT